MNIPEGSTSQEGNQPAVPEARSFRRWQWTVLVAAMFCYLFFYTGRQTFGFAIPGIEAEFQISKTTLGVVSAAMLWFYAAGQAVNGNLADKFGGRQIMSLGAVLSTIANWIVSFSTGLKSLSASWALNGYFQSMGWPAGSRVLANWWPYYERGKTYGFYVFAAGMASVLAFATSTVIVEVLSLDWRWIFRLPVVLMLVGGVTFYLVARNRPEDRGHSRPAHFDPPRDPQQAEPLKASEGSMARYRTVLRNKKIWFTGVAIGFQNAARYGLLVWVPVYFLGPNWEDDGGGAISPLWISLSLPVGMAVGALVNGQISDRLFNGRRSTPIFIFMAAGALAALGMYLVPQGSVILGVVLLFITGALVYGPQSSFWALCPDLVGTRMSGTATGVVNFFSYLVAGLMEPLIGYTIDSTGQTGIAFIVVAACCVVSALASLLIRR